MIGNNACGSRALGYGRTADNVAGMRVLLGRRLVDLDPGRGLAGAVRGSARWPTATSGTCGPRSAGSAGR